MGEQSYIVIGYPEVWGKGNTEEEAYANAKLENGGRVLKKWLVYEFARVDAEDTYIDRNGNLIFPEMDRKPEIIRRGKGGWKAEG